MPNRKCQETQTISISFEKAGQFTDPYRRLDKRMDRCLLKREVEFVNQALEHVAQQSMMLDLCCGTGEVTLMLQTRGIRTLGLDMNLQALGAFQQHLKDIPLIQGDAMRLSFKDGCFDAIVALHCFDLLDRDGFLQECGRLLGCGGLLIFDALNRHSYKLILKRLGRFLGPQFVSRPSHKWIDVFSCREVLQYIDLAGFALEAVRGYGWPPFSVNSNSGLVNFSAAVERILRLDRFSRFSPRIIVAVRKKAKC